ncbi:MAG: M15 family metallopeptidase [candidate division Zixibacteria bacterium]|nr:M15 family metallopeptidase [candidate division Zixibacteria bacterium]
MSGQGLNPGIPDGIFGQRTLGATQLFQRHHALSATGTVDRPTLARAVLLGFVDHDGLQRLHLHTTDPSFPPKPDFQPLAGNAALGALFGRFEYRAQPLPDNPENIVIVDDWEQKNIIRVEIAEMTGISGAPGSGKIRFHRLGADQMQALWKTWKHEGLLSLVLTWNGSFVPRFIRGKSTKKSLSDHAFGGVFDINVRWNPLNKIPALAGQQGSVRELVRIANEHGFYWGGHFSRKDGMHFEIARVL